MAGFLVAVISKMTTKNKIIFGLGTIGVLVIIIYLVLNFIFQVTNKTEGQFGHSKTKTEALKNDLYVVDYLPSKDTIVLLNGRKIAIEKVWAETMWSYHDRHPNKAENFGYNLQLEFQGDNEDFIFSLQLLDEDNHAFTNGMGQGKCVFNPKKLYDTISIIVEEKNPNRDVGWIEPIVTDTITLARK